MENEVFVKVSEFRNKDSEFVAEDERFIFQYSLIMKYLEKKIAGWNIREYFDGRKTDRVILYAITEFTDLFLKDWQCSSGKCKIECIADIRHDDYGGALQGYKIISFDKTIEICKKDKKIVILNCSIFHQNEIYRNFMEKGIPQEQIISVCGVLS